MILAIILLILIVLLLALIILFSFYIFLPSLNTEIPVDADTIIADTEKDFALPEKKEPPVTAQKAVVLCSCTKSFSQERSFFNEAYTCFMVKNTMGSGTDCPYACIGLGDCAKVCPQDAISIRQGTAVISGNCCGCGKCATLCPQNIITLVDRKTASIIKCNNNDMHSFTTCSEKQKEEKIEWNVKKDFKIWSHCYRIINAINSFFK